MCSAGKEIRLRWFQLTTGMFSPGVKSGISKGLKNEFSYTFGLNSPLLISSANIPYKSVISNLKFNIYGISERENFSMVYQNVPLQPSQLCGDTFQRQTWICHCEGPFSCGHKFG